MISATVNDRGGDGVSECSGGGGVGTSKRSSSECSDNNNDNSGNRSFKTAEVIVVSNDKDRVVRVFCKKMSNATTFNNSCSRKRNTGICIII